jgi:hypothetical protein
MIEAIQRIGEYALEKEGKSLVNPLDILVDNPANRETEGLLFIVLESGKDGFEYKGVNIEDYSKDKLRRYAYKDLSLVIPESAEVIRRSIQQGIAEGAFGLAYVKGDSG